MASSVREHSPDEHLDATREKFRSACDSCAASKVRCKKERPKCSRCQRLAIDCVYGPSRRKGKPPSNRTGSWAAWNSPASPMPAESSQEDGQQPAQMWQNDNGDAYGMSGIRASSRENTIPPEFLSNSFWDRYLQKLPTTEFDESSGMASRSNSNAAAIDLPPITPPLSDMPMAPFSTSSPNNASMPDLPTPSLSIDGGDNPCLSACLQTLATVFRLPNAGCQDRGYGFPTQPSSDAVLLTTRSVTETLVRLLSCSCTQCVQDLGLPFLLASIAAKVLHWYRAIYESEICPPQQQQQQQSQQQNTCGSNMAPPHSHTHHSSTSNSSGGSPPSSNNGTVFAMPLKIGTLNLPLATEKRMKAQMLLCEIQPFVQACYMFSGRTQTLKQGQDECVIFEMFRKYLQTGAVELRRSLEAICGRLS